MVYFAVVFFAPEFGGYFLEYNNFIPADPLVTPAHGIRAVINKGKFARFLQTYDPDILCLQETKAARDQVEIDLPEYHEHFYSAAKKGYSGTAIFSKVRPLHWRDGLPPHIIERFNLKIGRAHV